MNERAERAQAAPIPADHSGAVRALRVSSIRRRLLRWLLPLLLVIELVTSALDYRGSIAPVEAAYDQALADAALAVSAHLRPTGARLELDLSEQSISMLRADTHDRVFFRVLDPTGATLGGDADLDGPIGERVTAFFDGEYHGEAVRGVAYPVATVSGPATVIVAETIHKRRDARRELIVSRALEDLFAVAFTLLAVWYAIGLVLRPVERLAAQVRTRSPSDLQPLAPAEVPAEVRPLVEALNRLFDQIGATQDSQRRFIENAAHQLRTPLAGLKGQGDLAIVEARQPRLAPAPAPATPTPTATASASASASASATAPSVAPAPAPAPIALRLDRIRQATARVIHLTNQLLTLARSDRSSHDIASRQLVRLPELVDSVIAAHLDAALARGQDLGAETEPAMLRAVEWELREMLVNLVDNAIRYTPSGGRVTVRCGAGTAAAPFIEVEDTGPGIPPAERDRVFERFYRVSTAPPGGSGLGLAIVHEIASLHDATVRILEAPGGRGTIVRVDFPPPVRSAAPSARAGT